MYYLIKYSRLNKGKEERGLNDMPRDTMLAVGLKHKTESSIF